MSETRPDGYCIKDKDGSLSITLSSYSLSGLRDKLADSYYSPEGLLTNTTYRKMYEASIKKSLEENEWEIVAVKLVEIPPPPERIER